MTRSSRAVYRLAALAVLAALITGCGVRGLSFVQDHRVSITTPRDRSTVRLPVTVEWTAKDFSVAEGSAFGVAVDRSPPSPGDTLASLVRNDRACKERPGCPDSAYLADNGLFVTTDTKLTLTTLIRRPDGPDRHEVTIVLLNSHGERIGEAAFTVEFTVDRGASR